MSPLGMRSKGWPAWDARGAGMTSAIAGQAFRAAVGGVLVQRSKTPSPKPELHRDAAWHARRGGCRPAPPGVPREGAQLVKWPPKMSELPKVAGQSELGAGGGRGLAVVRDWRGASPAGQVGALRTST